MEKKEFKEGHKFLPKIFLAIFSVFIIALIVYTAVAIQNKIKEGKYIGQALETKNTITVSDTGEVYVKPDLAITVFSVVTEATTVAQAMEENTKKMNDIIAFIKNQGIEDKDLKTINFSIYPRYEWYDKESCVPPCPEGKRVLVGYEIDQSLEVKIRNMEKIGQIIEGATTAGANQVGDLQFTVDKQDEFKKQARDEAIGKAKTKAQELASQLGVRLVRINNFSESGAMPYYYASEKAPAGLGGGTETPQIETGQNKIEVTVSITYEIN